MEEFAKAMKRASENEEKRKRNDEEEDRKERIRLHKQYEALQQDPTLATSHPPTREDKHTTRQKTSMDGNKEITLIIHFHGGMIMNNRDKGDADNELVVYNVPPGSPIKYYHSSSSDGFFEAAHDAQHLVPPEKKLYILDNCNPGEYSYTKTSRVILPMNPLDLQNTDLLTEHIKNEYSSAPSTMSDLVNVTSYIEKVYTDDHPVHDARRHFNEKFRIIYI